MIRLNRIYTRAGDGGSTRLVGGQKVAKNDARIEAFGTVDELSACLGLVRCALAAPEPSAGGPHPFAAAAAVASSTSTEARALDTIVRRIQNELFNLGSDLATLTEDKHPQRPVIESRHILRLEQEIDAWNADLPELRSFVLPGGGWVAAYLHLARTVCRRAERQLMTLIASDPQAEPEGHHNLGYLNRLSDALFVMSRHAARIFGHDEPLWEPEKT